MTQQLLPNLRPLLDDSGRRFAEDAIRVVLPAVVTGTRTARRALHRAARDDGACALSTPQRALRHLAGGQPVPDRCEPCWDLVLDGLAVAGGHHERSGRPLEMLGGLINRATTRRTIDADRSHRSVQLGGIAKPRGTGGTVDHVRDAADSPWQAELVTLIVDAAAHDGPVPADVWPYDWFAAARAGRPWTAAGRAGLADIHDDVTAALALIVSVAGDMWYRDKLLGPLRARAAKYPAVRLDAAFETDDGVRQVTQPRSSIGLPGPDSLDASPEERVYEALRTRFDVTRPAESVLAAARDVAPDRADRIPATEAWAVAVEWVWRAFPESLAATVRGAGASGRVDAVARHLADVYRVSPTDVPPRFVAAVARAAVS